MSTYLSTILDARICDAIGSERLSVALIGPGDGKRQTLAKAVAEICFAEVREFDSYPPERNDLRQMLAELFEVVIVDLDADPEAAFDLVERIGGNRTMKVMVYSERHDPKLAVRFMRAGAHEYLLLPLDQGVLEAAFDRIAPTDRAKARLADKNRDTLAWPGVNDDRDVTAMPLAVDDGPANERVSSLETATGIAGPHPVPLAGIFLEVPKTLPADFIDWDNDEPCEMVTGSSACLDVAACDGEISNPPTEQWEEHKTTLASPDGEPNNPVPHFPWPVSPNDRAGFPGRTVQRQDTRSAETESPIASSGSNASSVDGGDNTPDLSKLKMQEADMVLFQMFRSAPKPKQGLKFASRALNIFRRERRLASAFDDPHSSTV